MYGRSAGIRGLVHNNYQILPNEHGNPFKELINFTLNCFKQYFLKKPDEADELLIQSFPVMQPYIKRYIYKQQNYIPIENRFDEQEAYDEFLFFCKHIFCTLYPDKRVRDEQIRNFFKIFYNEMIGFIERENNK